MKRIIISHVFRCIIFLCVIPCVDISANEQQSNRFTSSDQSIHLNYWQIAAVPESINSLHTLPDSLWQLFGPSLDLETYTVGNWIIRTHVEIKDSLNETDVFGLFPIRFVTSYEIYWDGIKIAQNGEIGTNTTDEKPGLYNFNLALHPGQVTRGKHTITLRISNYNNYSSWKWYYGDVIFGKYDTVLKEMSQSGYQASFISGIVFITFLFNLFLYISRQRRPEHLLFSVICLLVILDYLTNQAPLFFNSSTTFVHWENYAYQLITVLFTILFPAFFIYSFSFPKIYIGVIAVTNLVIFFNFTNLANVFTVMTLTVLLISSIITLLALYKRREGSIIIFVGLIAAWIAYYFNFAFNGLAATMVVCTSFSIARQFARKEKAEREAQLRSAHLENELLKKNINPHFLLNTLTSLIAWLRKKPKSAIKLIEALAEEFRMILQISSLKLIPIQQEIDLCTAHLKIMSYRKGADFKLETIGIAEGENIPPMIIHTLIENGLTHGYENKIKGTFTLYRRRNTNGVQYILSHDGEYLIDDQRESTGVGMRYIKSRLEESFPNRWELISHWQPGGWETIIEIKDT